ncbi:HepT-like ribonuclease domain-containing protein [Rhizobium sp. LjRoot254]|uniref:HepT-like ribonuclease domain-containing protein n=1 Tax=Rhizobium sp. LjRoot254 TaxID=3342297 RepID=UPI003ECED5E8
MDQRTRLRLEDIQDAIEQLNFIFGGTSYSDFVTDKIKRAACERFLEIVSEATRHIPDDYKAQFPEIPWKQIADIGNHLRHAYHRIDAEILWQIHASGQLADLRSAIEAMLNGSEPR